MKTLHIYAGFRFGNRMVTGRHFGEFSVNVYDDDGIQTGVMIMSGNEIKYAVHEETGYAYDYYVYDDDEEEED